MRRLVCAFILGVSCSGTALLSQTTQGLILGRVTDLATGRPLANAIVIYENPSAGTRGERTAGDDGYYTLPLLPPGPYRLRAAAGKDYQPREFQEVALAVAGFLEVNFELRPLADVMDAAQAGGIYFREARALLDFYGPDVDAGRALLLEPLHPIEGRLEATISTVISPREIQDLPLAGRDLYTALILLPAVTSDTATSGVAGLSVNGQRPTSSNFLLDGVENNNYLITGPAVTVAPEAMQEYRVSTSTFSAEYGGTGGVLANAVTQAGGSHWHGIAYFYLKNTALDANDFQRNLGGLARPPLHELEPGFQAGGPLRKDRLFVSTAFEYLRSRSYGDPVTVALPTTGFLNLLAGSPGDPNAARALNLLKTYPWPVPNSKALAANESFSLPSFVDRALLFERLDYTPAGGVHHVMGRAAASLLQRPQFIWSPYQGFDSPLKEDTVSAMAGVSSNLSPLQVNEARLSWGFDDLSWDRAHSELPTLTSLDGVLLPGSLSSYAYRNRGRNLELTDQFVWSLGRHLLKFGGGLLLRRIDGYLTYGRDGEFDFLSILQFAASSPFAFSGAVDRGALPQLQVPSFDRRYSDNQFHFFAQDTYRVTPRLSLNYGLRYENYGAPRNIGATKDLLVQPAADGLAGATLVPESVSKPMYSSDNLAFAPRVGGSYAVTRNGRTLLRGGFGIFYDRPYDNLWENVRNNNVVLPQLFITAPHFNYMTPAAQVLPQLSAQQIDTSIPNLTWIDRNLRNGYVQSAFLGFQQQLTTNWTLEVNGMETLGRRLITTDILNRDSGTLASWPQISYRGNQGSSDYSALAALLRYRSTRWQFQAAYTWSHSIDNESSPLAGDFFNLYFSSLTANLGYQPVAGFSIAGNSSFDRGNSDFDQRQNLVLMAIAELPNPARSSKVLSVFRDWRMSSIAAFRTGFPYSVYTQDGSPGILNPRADLVNPSQEFIDDPAPGGKVLLNQSAFSVPSSLVGNLGRNAMYGPGLYNIDCSFARTFTFPWLGEAGRVQIRADAFNVLNHANLGNPDSTLGSDFGVALYGRKPMQTGFPGLIPLTETPRQIQLMFRLQW